MRKKPGFGFAKQLEQGEWLAAILSSVSTLGCLIVKIILRSFLFYLDYDYDYY